MNELLLKRIERERRARELAEKILEEKSREIYFKNKELEKLNKLLNNSLNLKVAELQETEAEKITLFENAIIGIVVSIDGSIIRINNMFSQMLGHPTKHILGKKFWSFIHSDQTQSIPSYDTVGKWKRPFTEETMFKRGNNSFFWAKVHTTPFKNHLGEIKYHISIIEDIHEKKVSEFKTHTLVSQLRESNNDLQNFAHIVSHDLKAPLNGVHTVINWIRECPNYSSLAQGLKENLELIETRVEKMHELIDGIISYSKFSQTHFERELLNLSEVIEASLYYVQVPAHIQIEVSGNSPWLYINKFKIQQVFNNLIDNAIRHIDKKKGHIQIHSDEDDDYIVISLKDNGTGIKKSNYPKIFQTFSSFSAIQGQSGIGLSIVKKIIEGYGGNITVDSVIGESTEFIFTLAKEKVHVPTPL